MTKHSTVYSSILVGLEPKRVQIDVTVSDTGGPCVFNVHGLTDTAARETRVRVMAALAQTGIGTTNRWIDVKIAPDVPYGAAALDLAIATGVLWAITPPRARVSPTYDYETLILGELSLSGEVRHVRGLLAHLERAKLLGFERAIVPAANRQEAGIVARWFNVVAAPSLAAVATDHLELVPWSHSHRPTPTAFDFADIQGMPAARRALEIAAAGNHNVLLIGPPGSGKTMLARRLTSILPRLTEPEANEITRIHSVAGLLTDGGLVGARPFRAPHHTVSEAGLVGGGVPTRPGEVTLAHGGVLYLDELPEFRKSTLEVLCYALAKGKAGHWSRGALFPAQTQLVAAMNGCPCGYAGDGVGARCTCSPERVRAYLHRISGPILDQIDIRVSVPPFAESMAAFTKAVSGQNPGESSAAIAERVAHARAEKAAREVTKSHVEQGSPIEPSRLYRVARTIADLDHSTVVLPKHREEAVTLTQHLDQVPR